MNTSTSLLRLKIEQLFPLSPAPNIRLSDALIASSYGDEASAIDENWTTWNEIKDWQIGICDCLFSYYPDKGKYFLGRYMLFVLDEVEGKLEEEILTDGGIHVVRYLAENKKNEYQLFSKEHKELFDEFLNLIENKDEFYREIIDDIEHN